LNPSPTLNEEHVWTRRFGGLLAGLVLFRLGLGLLFGARADLLGDEAYYWDWGRQPAWGYFSKPPMIGWLMAGVGRLTGNAEWGIRLAPLVFGTATLAAAFALARRLFGGRTAFLAAVLLALTPGNAGLNLFFTIDAPLLLAWSCGLLCAWLAIEQPRRRLPWIGLALTLGFGVLSKQMMLVFPVLLLLFGLVSPADRPLLRNPRLWLAVLAGAACLVPVLEWNRQHHWITVEHTKHHFDSESLGVADWLARTLEFPAVQALVYTPVTFAALVMVVWLSLRRWRDLGRAERFLLIFSVPPLMGFLLLSLRQHINPNWPAVFYLPLFVLAAAWLDGRLSGLPAARPGWRRACLRSAIAITVVLHLALGAILLGALLAPGKIAETQGWSETGRRAGAFLDRVPRPQHTFVLVAGYRYDAAQLAFTLPQQPRVYRWSKSEGIDSQYEVWPGPEERLGDDALILQAGKAAPRPLAARLAGRFEAVESLGRVEVSLDGGRLRTFDVFLGRHLQAWPKPGGTGS
jgi:4-amino-4-deoxy-L-arabinose transferase-like glycosyltransferase